MVIPSEDAAGRDAIIAMLAMERHPAAGWVSPHYQDSEVGGRSNLSSMYYLLAGDEPMPAHKLHGIEIWHYYQGAPAEIIVSDGSGDGQADVLGPDLAGGERPQLAIPAYAWLSCRSLGAWTLFGRTMSPGFSLRRTIVLSADG